MKKYFYNYIILKNGAFFDSVKNKAELRIAFTWLLKYNGLKAFKMFSYKRKRFYYLAK